MATKPPTRWDCVGWPLHVVFDPAAHARECWMNMDHITSLVTLQTHLSYPKKRKKKKLHKSQPRREHKHWPTSPWNQSQMPWTSMDTNGHQWTTCHQITQHPNAKTQSKRRLLFLFSSFLADRKYSELLTYSRVACIMIIMTGFMLFHLKLFGGSPYWEQVVCFVSI